MLLGLLLHVLIFHLLTAREVPPRKDSQYIVQHRSTCPATRYYFWREPPTNALEPGPCFLCFCQQDHTAICWKRNNRRCDVKSFQYHGSGKRSSTRIRRSPVLVDITVHDAIKDGKGKKIGSRKGTVRKFVAKIPASKSKTSTSNIPKRTPPRAAKFKPVIKAITTPSLSINLTRITTGTVQPPYDHNDTDTTHQQPQRIIKKIVLLNSSTPGPRNRRITYKRIAPTKFEARNVTTTMTTKNIGTQKPIDIGVTKEDLEMEIAKKIMERLMINLKHSIVSEIKNITNIAGSLARNQTSVKKNVKKYKKPNPKFKESKKVYKKPPKKPQGKPPSKWKKHIKKSTKKPVKKSFKKSTKQPATSKASVRSKRNVKLAEDFDTPSIVAQGYFTPYSVVLTTNKLLVPDDYDANCSLTSERSSTLGESQIL